MDNPDRKNLLGLISGLTAASLWGGMYVVSKVLLNTIPPFTLLTLRLALGFAALSVPLGLRGWPRLPRQQFLQVAGIGIIGYGISLGFQFLGTKLSTAANGALVTSATPAFVLPFAALLLHESITRRKSAALLISTLGVLAVIDPRTAEFHPGLFQGNLFLLAAALTWALYSVLIRLMTRKLDVLVVSWAALLGGLPLTIPLGLGEIAGGGLGTFTPGIFAGVLFLGIIATALAMYLWNAAFAILDAGVASLTFFAQPLVGAILGYIFLGERFTPLFFLGAFCIGLGLVIASTEK
jgi:drug/metabolite transporter (DMT)-like permease